MTELNQVPALFLVDPECALVSCYHEIAETLSSFFAARFRTVKHYIIQDAKQLKDDKIRALVQSCQDVIVPNTYQTVTRDFADFDFVKRSDSFADMYDVEEISRRVKQKNELIFGNLLNNVQFFAEVGGFDALINLFKMGMSAQDGEEAKQDSAESQVKLPFRIMNALT